MKNIVFIGKSNYISEDIVSELQRYYIVKKYDFNGTDAETISEEINNISPILVIISMIGLDIHVGDELFTSIKHNNSSVHVLTVGSEYECGPYMEYYKSPQFVNLTRPVSKETVVNTCAEIIESISPDHDNGLSGGDRKHILIVDDNAMMLRNLKNLLQDQYSVAVAASGAQAFTQIGRKKPDIILLDYEMPIMNGEMVLEMILQDEETKGIPVVFLTGVSDKEVVNSIIQLKPAGYILKPPSRERLLETIDKVLLSGRR